MLRLKCLTHSQTSPGFYVYKLLKTLWEKEKLLVMSNFSFSHSVFYLSGELSAIFVKFRIVVCRRFEFGGVQNQSFGKGLNVVNNLEMNLAAVVGSVMHLVDTMYQPSYPIPVIMDP